MTAALKLLHHLKDLGETLHKRGMEHVNLIENPTFIGKEITNDTYLSLHNETVSTFLEIQKSQFHSKGKRIWSNKERKFVLSLLETFDTFDYVLKKDVYDTLEIILDRNSGAMQVEVSAMKKRGHFTAADLDKELFKKELSNERIEQSVQKEETQTEEKQEVVITVKDTEVKRVAIEPETKEEEPVRNKHVLEQAFDNLKSIPNLNLNAFGTQFYELTQVLVKQQKEIEYWKNKWKESENKQKEIEQENQKYKNVVNYIRNHIPYTENDTQPKHTGSAYQTDKNGLVSLPKAK